MQKQYKESSDRHGGNSGRRRNRVRGALNSCAVRAGALGAGATVLMTLAVAPASASDTCANAQFRGGMAALLPDCRAYEQVSPVLKNGYGAGHGTDGSGTAVSGGPVAGDGSVTAYYSDGSFADANWGGGGAFNPLAYLARRTDSGWTSTALLPRPPVFSGFNSYGVTKFSTDFSSSLLGTGFSLTSDPDGNFNWYRRANSTGATPTLLATRDPDNGQGQVGASDDLGHLAFSATGLQTAEPGQPVSGTKVYESRNGDLRLVSREPGTNDPIQNPATIGSPESGGSPGSVKGAVSASGEHIFFSSPTSGNDTTVYRRSGGIETVIASPTKLSPADPLGPRLKRFEAATLDGNQVFFVSAEQLTDDANTGPTRAGADLYRYDFAADGLVNIAATQGGNGARVQGVVELAEDGSRVYFVALGAVGGEGSDGQRNLYLWEDDETQDGAIRYIATLHPTNTPGDLPGGMSDDDNWAWGNDKTAQTTPDGSVLLFQSRANLTGFDSNGTSQIYIYNALADQGAGDLICVSCLESGTPTARALTPIQGNNGLGGEIPNAISDDGRRVIFSSPDPLLARDTNGRYDAYLWNRGSTVGSASAGDLSLLSTGSSSRDSYAHVLSSDGGSAFFRTIDRLVPQDIDGEPDLYVARIGGGFAAQQVPASPDCQGDQCQGYLSEPPAISAPGSAALVVGASERGGRIQARCERLGRVAKRQRNIARKAARRAKLARNGRQVTGRRNHVLQRRAKRALGQAVRAKRQAKRCRGSRR